MSELSRSQLAVYGAVAVALLLVGARAVADQGSEPGRSAPAAVPLKISEEGGRDVVVHVAGAVRDPGVYRLPAGARVTDAVRRAGGGGPRALLDQVNLAARLSDGQQVVVPERAAGASATAAVPGAAGDEGPISLGSATVEQLDTIEGIGPVTAGDIIAFRDQHGGLSSVDQLDEVNGIGPATMEALRGRLQP
ncbi:MAG: helix-hairpin-helix domain-containing protein [Actinomycetota bacterium]